MPLLEVDQIPPCPADIRDFSESGGKILYPERVRACPLECPFNLAARMLGADPQPRDVQVTRSKPFDGCVRRP